MASSVSSHLVEICHCATAPMRRRSDSSDHRWLPLAVMFKPLVGVMVICPDCVKRQGLLDEFSSMLFENVPVYSADSHWVNL